MRMGQRGLIGGQSMKGREALSRVVWSGRTKSG